MKRPFSDMPVKVREAEASTKLPERRTFGQRFKDFFRRRT
jgi:hypothetical protein